MSDATKASEAFEAARLWLVQALPTLSSRVDKAYPPDADAARSTRPYAVVQWKADRKRSATPYVHDSDTAITPDPGAYDHKRFIYQRRTATMQIDIFGADPDEAMDLLTDLRMSPYVIADKAILRDAGIAVRFPNDVIDTTELRDTVNEPDAMLDVAIDYVQSKETPYAVIDTAIIPYTQNDAVPTDPSPLESTITVDLS